MEGKEEDSNNVSDLHCSFFLLQKTSIIGRFYFVILFCAATNALKQRTSATFLLCNDRCSAHNCSIGRKKAAITQV